MKKMISKKKKRKMQVASKSSCLLQQANPTLSLWKKWKILRKNFSLEILRNWMPRKIKMRRRTI